MVDEALFENIEVVWEGNVCSFCGQESNPNSRMCDYCMKNMTTVVLALCKELLYNAGHLAKLNPKEKKQKGTSKESVQELEIFRVLDQFPYELAKRTVRYRKALETEGVWFSHMVAFRFISHIRSDRNLAPPMVVCDPMYQIVRQQVFDFLQNEKPDSETCEAFNNVYHVPDAEDDGRAVIQDMIGELERLKRLKIARPKTTCSKCGKEMTTGKQVCEECERDDALNARLAIFSNSPPPLIQTEPHKSSVRSQGMHTREDLP